MTVKENSLYSSAVKQCELILFSIAKECGEMQKKHEEMQKRVQTYEEICCYLKLQQSAVVKINILWESATIIMCEVNCTENLCLI